jgi:hypothetical protein
MYSTQLTLGATPGLHIISATGTTSVSLPHIDSTSGVVSQVTTNLIGATEFRVWGVKPTVESNQLIMINSDGYPVNDTAIRFAVLPTDYKYSTTSLYLDFYEKDTAGNESWMGFVQADPSGKIILTRGGAKFNPAYTYSVQLILDRGRQAEVKSAKIPLKIVKTTRVAIILQDKDIPIGTSLVSGVTTSALTVTSLAVTIELCDAVAGLNDDCAPLDTVGGFIVEEREEQDGSLKTYLWLLKNADSDNPDYLRIQSSPAGKKYRMTIESKEPMVSDNVMNKWDMDETTLNIFETKTHWTFGVSEHLDITTLVPTYDCVPSTTNTCPN